MHPSVHPARPGSGRTPRRYSCRRGFFCAALVLAAATGCLRASAQAPDIKWLQQPDLTSTGIDIRVDSSDDRIRVIADDFECTEESFLTDVHFWGSWLNDLKGEIEVIHLSIYSDDPVGPGGSDPENMFSKPDRLLWEKPFGEGQFKEELMATVEAGEFFWDAPFGQPIFPGDHQVWEYTIDIDPVIAFLQTGSVEQPVVYWLAIRVDLKKPTFAQFGWKTRLWPDHYNDDAVIGPPPWTELKYPAGHPLFEEERNSIDMAFALSFAKYATEIDLFEYTLATMEIQLPSGDVVPVRLSGPTTVAVYFEGFNEGDAADDDIDGLDEVETEMISMNLAGMSELGPIHVTLNTNFPTVGQIAETTNATPGTLDVAPFTSPDFPAESFFDVFFEVEVGGAVYHNEVPKRMHTLIKHKPPAPGDVYSDCTPIELFDELGNPTGIYVVCARHEPNPPVETDIFPFTRGGILLGSPTGIAEWIHLQGPATVHVIIPPNGDAADTDFDGRDQVPTEMVQLDLAGNWPTLGPVWVRLDPGFPTLGEMEEQVNNTPGTLDVMPFTPFGTIDSFFDVYFQIQLGGVWLHPATPVRLEAVLTHKPPAPGERYRRVTQAPIPLLDPAGQPTGFTLDDMWHVPVPVMLDIRLPAAGMVEVGWPVSSTAGYILQATPSLYPPAAWSNIPPPYLIQGTEFIHQMPGNPPLMFFRLEEPIP